MGFICYDFPEVIDMTIGKRIRDARKAKGYTQEYLAEKLIVSRQAVSKWEQDQTSPDTGNLIALAELLDTSVEFLATGKRSSVPESVPVSGDAFYMGSLIPLAVMFLCSMIGLFSGEYTDMVTIPVDSGTRVGIPFLLYGDSPAAIALLIISFVAFLLYILMLFLGRYLNHNKK